MFRGGMIRSDYLGLHTFAGMGKLPGPLRLTPSFPFAGRSRELATLRTLIPRADGEGLRFALIGGEAGSGKSRLMREFAHEAAASGVVRATAVRAVRGGDRAARAKHR